MFLEMLLAVMVGGLLVASTVGYCLYICYKWVMKDVMKSLEEAYAIYLKRSYDTFKVNE
jgi:hypothetical protein